MVFAWRYYKNISSVLYKPALVFKKFSFLHLLDANEKCLCNTAKRLQKYLDPATAAEQSSVAAPTVHVRTLDVSIIQHPDLRKAVSQGLNHIPVKPTSIRLCIDTALDAFDQLCQILPLHRYHFPHAEAREWIKQKCKDKLLVASKQNQYGFRSSGRDLMTNPVVQNEIRWLTENLLCASLDKAANNCCFYV